MLTWFGDLAKYIRSLLVQFIMLLPEKLLLQTALSKMHVVTAHLILLFGSEFAVMTSELAMCNSAYMYLTLPGSWSVSRAINSTIMTKINIIRVIIVHLLLGCSMVCGLFCCLSVVWSTKWIIKMFHMQHMLSTLPTFNRARDLGLEGVKRLALSCWFRVLS